MRFLFLLLLMTAANAAYAAKRAVVAIGSCADGLTADPTRQIRDALSRTAMGYEFVSEADTARPLGGIPASLADVERLIESARDDVFRNQSYRAAEDKLVRAVHLVDDLPPTEATWRANVDARALLAFARTQLGQHQEMSRAAAEAPMLPVFLVDPEVEVDPDGWFLPAWRREFLGDIRARQTKGPPAANSLMGRILRREVGELNLTSTPPGLPVAINGRPMKETPFSVGLPVGNYVVEGIFPGRRGPPHMVTVTSGQVTDVAIDTLFDGSVHQAKGPCISTLAGREERVRTLAKAGRLIGVDQIVGVRIEEPNPGERYWVVGVVHSESGKEGNEAKIPVTLEGPRSGALAQLAQFIVEGPGKTELPLVVPVNPVAKAQVPSSTVEAAPEAPVAAVGNAQRVIGWSLVGVGVAAAGTAGFFGWQARDEAARMEKLCHRGICTDETLVTSYARVRQRRDDATRTALMIGVPATIAGAVGAYLLFTAESSTSPAITLSPAPGGVGVTGSF